MAPQRPIRLSWPVAALIAAAIGLWLIGEIWLRQIAAWPADCVPAGRNRARLLTELACSAGLLKGGTAELALFASLWSVPVTIAALFIAALWKKRGHSHIQFKPE